MTPRSAPWAAASHATSDGAASAGATVYFFGNCQLQFYARELLKAGDVRVVCSGRAQVPFDCPEPEFMGAAPLYADARRVQAQGGRTILVLQETARGQFTRGLVGRRAGYFDEVFRFPYVHFRSPWPNFRLKVAGRFTPRSVARLFEAERDEFDNTIERCGGGFDTEAYWRDARENLTFYHPGHPNARVLLDLHDAFLHRQLRSAGVDVSRMRRAIARSSGLALTSLHPIEPEWGDAVGCAWHRKPAYGAWMDLKTATDIAAVRAAEAAKTDLSREFDRYVGALFRDDLAFAYITFGDHEAAALNGAEAAILLPGQRKVLSKAIGANARIGAWGRVEDVLMASLSFLHEGTHAAAALTSWLRRFHGEPARQIVERLSAAAPHALWMRRLLDPSASVAPAAA
jgi:hypothetical protein